MTTLHRILAPVNRRRWVTASSIVTALGALTWAWRKPLADRPQWMDDFDRHEVSR
jgi:hypothetical protein